MYLTGGAVALTAVSQGQSVLTTIFDKVRSQLGPDWEKRVTAVITQAQATQQTGKQLLNDKYQKYGKEPAEHFYNSGKLTLEFMSFFSQRVLSSLFLV